MQFSQLGTTESGSLIPVESHCSLANSFLLSGLIVVLTGFLGLRDCGRFLGAKSTLGRLYGLGRLGRSGSTRGGWGTRTRRGRLSLGLLSTKYALQTGGLVRRAAVLILFEIGKTAGLGVDICHLPLALCVWNENNMVSILLGFISLSRRAGTLVTYKSRPASCRWGCW